MNIFKNNKILLISVSSLLSLTILLSSCGNSAGNNSRLITIPADAGASQESQTVSDNGNNSGSQSSSGSSGSQSSSGSSGSSGNMDFSKSDADMFTERDLKSDYDESKCALIKLNGDSISSGSDGVKISGTTAVITDGGTYILSGTLNNGMIIVDAKDTDKPQLILNGVSITSETSAPLYILEADKVFVTSASGTSNTLSNGGSFTAIDKNNIDAAIFSKQDLTLNGSGSLTVTSPAGHGITCKDDLVLSGGTYRVNSSSHGIDANDSVRITGSSITLNSGKDGIHAENTDDASLGFVYISDTNSHIDIKSDGDGISAGAYIQIEDGSFNIVSGGGSKNASKLSSDSSIKGLKASGELMIKNGSFVIDSADDSIHSNASITINGGSFEIATGDDGFHADETLTVNAGNINISKSYEGLEALRLIIAGGDISLVASDDGLNAAGGVDSSGFGGFHGNDSFGGRGQGKPNKTPGGMPSSGIIPGSSAAGLSVTEIAASSDSDTPGIVISGGTIYINASGDGIDSNGTLEISGGHITVTGPIQGDTSTLDYDISGIISGGTFIGTGASKMAQSLTSSTQGVVALNAGNRAAGERITLTDASGNILISHTPELPFEVIILSSPDLVKGKTYTISSGSMSKIVTAG